MRVAPKCPTYWHQNEFPFLFGGTFIEGWRMFLRGFSSRLFPFIFGGTFIEGIAVIAGYAVYGMRFPFLFGGTFIEGLTWTTRSCLIRCISLPFRRDFH